MIKNVSTDHQRGIVNLENLLEWHRSEGNEIVQTVEQNLQEKGTQLQELLDEHEKQKKKLKKGYDEWLLENPFNEEDYKFPSDELLTELLMKRLEHPDCNAGAIFDGIYGSKLWKNTEHMMDIVLRAIPK